jgi:hypothetical protein
MPQLSGATLTRELAQVIDSVEERLLPHERADDLDVYARLAPLLGGEDPLAAMSGAHREIFRMVRSLRQMAVDLPRDGTDGTNTTQLHAIQRLLYALEAIVRLHCAQEEELFHAVGGDA